MSVGHVNNTFGTINDVHRIIEIAHRYNVPVLIDGAQSIAHTKVDVQELGADFFVFSGHKIYAPTGIGVVYGRKAMLDILPPWQGGGLRAFRLQRLVSYWTRKALPCVRVTTAPSPPFAPWATR